MASSRQEGERALNAPIKGFYADLLPDRALTTEQLADDALLALSKLRDRLVHEGANIPACRVDEAMEITLAAVRETIRG